VLVELLDEIGLDIGYHVLKSLGSKLDPPLEAPAGIAKALEKKWLGKKSGKGFYVHPEGKKKGKQKDPEINLELAELLAAGKPAAQVGEADIQWRLVLPMVNEAAKLLAERVADSADTVDLATVFGIGFAPFRGGLVRFAQSVGSEQLVTRMDELAAKHGPRFAPAESLRRHARDLRDAAAGTPVAEAGPVGAGPVASAAPANGSANGAATEWRAPEQAVLRSPDAPQ